jgi:hypothetical protein
VTYGLKVRSAKREETSVAKERLGKHVPAVTDTRATIDQFLEAVFSVRSAPRLCKEKTLELSEDSRSEAASSI